MPTPRKKARKPRRLSKHPNKIASEHPEPRRSHFDGEIARTIKLTIQDGVVLIGGDAHYIPGETISTAHKAFVRFIKELSPRHVIVNGDVLDASIISRHARI